MNVQYVGMVQVTLFNVLPPTEETDNNLTIPVPEDLGLVGVLTYISELGSRLVRGNNIQTPRGNGFIRARVNGIDFQVQLTTLDMGR